MLKLFWVTKLGSWVDCEILINNNDVMIKNELWGWYINLVFKHTFKHA